MHGVSITVVPYPRYAVDPNRHDWPGAGRVLLDELERSRDRFALIADGPPGADVLVERLTSDLDQKAVSVGATTAASATPPPLVDLESAVGDASILFDLDLLLWPELGLPILPFLAKLARRRPLIAVWPGHISNDRARYSVAGRPDHADKQLSDVVVLRPRSTRFPDEVPYAIERITR